MPNKPSDYDYQLPSELIAHHPIEPREAARLLVWPGLATDKTFADLPQLLQPGDVLVVNNSKVIPARLHFTRQREEGAPLASELLLHRPQGDFQTWTAFAQKTKKLKPGDCLQFPQGMTAAVLGRADEHITLRFNATAAAVEAFIDQVGEVPLPPYIDRATTASDSQDYQTVFAQSKGSVAAPTAGLHFSAPLLAALQARGVELAPVTLHVGAGTFQPMYPQLNDIQEHKMHAEWGEVTPATVVTLQAAQQRGNKIIAVGTTSLRLLETAARSGQLKPFVGDTDIFITPGFKFHAADQLITNFHLPQSTLLILVAAFIGYPAMQALYQTAVAARYRFYSYGDGCLLSRAS